MNTEFKKEVAEPIAVFMPEEISSWRDWQSGATRKFEPRRAIPWQWPNTTKERRAAFATWHKIAMKHVGDAQVSFRLMAVVERFVNWNSGTFWATNVTLADVGGECSVRTIKRDIAAYRDLGIFITEYGWRKTSAGKFKRTRLVRLSVPVEIAREMAFPDGLEHGDITCPYRCSETERSHGEMSCPEHRDNSCPFTFEGHMKRSSIDAA